MWKKVQPKGSGAADGAIGTSAAATRPRNKYPPIMFTRCLDAESAQALAHHGSDPGAPWLERRDGFIVRILLSTGLRRAELASLTEENIHWWGKHPWLHLVGKGGRERWIPLNPGLVAERKRLVETIPKSYSRPSVMPFAPSIHGKNIRHLSGRTIYAACTRSASATGVRSISPHILRHTAATLMLSTRAPLAGVQGILGHSNIQTTARYLHLLPETLIAAASDDFYEAIGVGAMVHPWLPGIRIVGKP